MTNFDAVNIIINLMVLKNKWFLKFILSLFKSSKISKILTIWIWIFGKSELAENVKEIKMNEMKNIEHDFAVYNQNINNGKLVLLTDKSSWKAFAFYDAYRPNKVHKLMSIVLMLIFKMARFDIAGMNNMTSQ